MGYAYVFDFPHLCKELSYLKTGWLRTMLYTIVCLSQPRLQQKTVLLVQYSLKSSPFLFVCFKFTSLKKAVAAIISITNVTGLLLRMTCITSLISITKKQIVYIHTESCVTAADSVSLSLFNIGK